MIEVVPGVYRLAWAVGTKPMAMYLIDGPFVTIVDTGLIDTPETIYQPALARLGRRPEDVRLAVITHADADHIGGNASATAIFPNLLLAAHLADVAMSSDPAVIVRERYDAFAPYGLRYDDAVFAMLKGWMGRPRGIDIGLTGGERLRLLKDEWFEVVHVPGHTLGHIALVNRGRGYAIAGDACFGASQLDTAGDPSAPPPYVTVDGYLATLRTLASLDLNLLLTCHYPVMHREEIAAFLRESQAWVDRTDQFVQDLLVSCPEGQTVTLPAAVGRADPVLGPFGFPRDLQFALLAHFTRLVERGVARPHAVDGMIGWQRSPA